VDEDYYPITKSDGWGRLVTATAASMQHIAEGHPEVRPADLESAIENADQRTRSRRGNSRELLWARGIGPARWFVVVVSYKNDRGFVVTAYGSTAGPKEADKL
jgi:hypothetical protein